MQKHEAVAVVTKVLHDRSRTDDPDGWRDAYQLAVTIINALSDARKKERDAALSSSRL